jgi:hypothetical protein
MIGRKALTGLSLLCALAFCAFAAPSAFAVTSGTTAVTCVPTPETGGTNDYGDAHCDGTKSLGGFGHKALAGNPTKEVEGPSLESAVLTTTAGGLETEIVCSTSSATFTVENSLVGEVHKVTVKELNKITYESCTVPKPAGQECKVKSKGEEKAGMISTNALKGESVEPSMGIEFKPVEGTTFTTLVLEGCKTAGLNKEYAVTGTVTSTPSGSDSPNSSGATLVVALAKNASSTLEVGGQKAGLKSSNTVKMEAGHPIATTTAPFTAP